MLKLKMKTDPRWVELAENNIKEVMTDHAFCEQKAASNAISMIVKFPEQSELVKEMSALVQEEMQHFNMVHEKILERGWTLGPERKDDYVNKLGAFFQKGGSRTQQLVNRLLIAAMIEARSCERFKTLSENIKDPELASFYYELMKSEAGHYTMFIGLARKYGDPEGINVNQLWEQFLEFEGELIGQYGRKETIHG
ncbi:MAG: tRNA-(ms[2]io[6]A)-hydroxylase [Flavobacteriales bacterium]